MQVIRDGDYYKTMNITGPAHNFLGVKFTTSQVAEVVVEEKQLSGSAGGMHRLDPEEVRRKVLEGVDAANLELGTQLRVERIQFVPTDTPRLEVYVVMAKALAEEAASHL